jgi:hypothetical protein
MGSRVKDERREWVPGQDLSPDLIPFATIATYDVECFSARSSDQHQDFDTIVRLP